MNKRSAVLLSLFFAAAVPSSSAQKASAWLLPNFSDRLEVEISNPSDHPVKTLAVIPVAEADRIAPQFPGTLAIAVVPGSPAGSPPSSLPSQADDLDGDGTPDEFVFPVEMQAHTWTSVHIYYSTTLHDRIPWPRQVFASHAFGYNHATAALESEAIGYRTYGGFFLDVQARDQGHPGLNNSLVGYFPASSPSLAGRDIFHIGDSLGLGGLFLRAGSEVFRPPLNVPDYAHKPAPLEAPSYRVISSGPVRAVIEARMRRWTIANDVVSIRALYSIAADAEDVECDFTITPVSLSRDYEVGAGIRHLPKMHAASAPGWLGIEGEQDPAIGPLGLALYFDPATVSKVDRLQTGNISNDVILFQSQLQPGHTVSGRYWLAADWSGSGIPNLLDHLRQEEPQVRASVRIDDLRHSSTPEPQRLEEEAY